MLDVFTLDQLRVFVTIVEEGSFSAAARRVQRVQSAVSHAMANLEGVLGVALWDRQTRVPTLTEAGKALLLAARKVITECDQLKRLADGLGGGLEAQLGLCVDQLFPLQGLVDLGRRFSAEFPTVSLRLQTETLQAVAERVLDGSVQLGVVGPAVETRDLVRRHVTTVKLVTVVARDHRLARLKRRPSADDLQAEVQIVLSERGPQKVPDQAVLSARTWRVADLAAKHELIRAGLGWGNLPEHLVRDDLKKKRLVVIRPEAWDAKGHMLQLTLVHRPGMTLGPATRWLIETLTEVCRREAGGEAVETPTVRFSGRKKARSTSEGAAGAGPSQGAKAR